MSQRAFCRLSNVSNDRKRATTHFCLLMALLLLAALLTACNSKTPTPTPVLVQEGAADGTPMAEAPNGAQNDAQNGAQNGATAAATETPAPLPVAGRLVLWHSWAGADGDALNAMLADAAQRYPEMTVETLFVAYDDLIQAYVSAVENGGGPDLILAPNQWLGDLVEAQALVELDEQSLATELDAYWPAALDSMRWDGVLYGLPTNFELVSLYYNRSLIAPDALPATTDDLLALVQSNPQLGMGLYNSLYHLYWGFPAYGARLFNADSQVVIDQTAGAADYLNWLLAMDETPGNFIDSDYGMLTERFKKGEFAFFVDGPWSIDELRGALGDDLAVTQLPAGSAGPAQPWLSADGIFLNPATATTQQQLALRLALHLGNVESGNALAQLARRLPANRAVTITSAPLLAAFMQQAEHAAPMPLIPEMKEVWGYGGDMLIKALNGVAEPGAVLQETATLINEANGK